MKNVFRLRFLLILIILNMTACAQNKDHKDKNASEAKHLNRLKDAKSPYLQMHADNPVDWYEWGPEALQKAKRENKPLLISIGYASCHWCHVMERESFMDSTTAKLMNDHFVSIKVDREERPDIDQIYMSAAQLLNGQGGWPLNAFALPDGKPFFVGTYFPNKQWNEVLQKVAAAYENQHEQVVKQANALTNGISQQDVIETPKENAVFSMEDYKIAYENLEATVDFKKGGYRNNMKFPLPVGWEFALQYHYLTGNKKALKAVQTTLTEMARGGIYDQIGGGFARYSTDEDWFAPHFEKMLYDNGQLISLYANAYKVEHQPLYAEVIHETLDFVKRELTDEKGGFYSSIGADSEGKEGQFYVWKSTEIDSILDSETAQLIKEYYHFEKNGNWEDGNNILFVDETNTSFAKKHNLTPKEWGKTLDQAKGKLLNERAKRERPATDDKVLTGWNALMMQGYLDAYTALGEEEYLKIALKNADFLKNTMLQSNGRLFRTYRNGSAGTDAFLEDYALLAEAYLKLYQVTFDKQWLDLSHELIEYALNHFQDKTTGMFYYTSDLAENLVARKTELSDNVIPSSNSVMASVLYKLGEYYDKPAYKEQSKKMLTNVLPQVKKTGPYYANWSELLGLIVAQPNEVAIMGTESIQKNKNIQTHYLPTDLFMGGRDENLPLLENKLVPAETIIYVCKNKTCKLPVQTVAEALKQF